MKYSFSATDDILYELKKSYEDMKRRVEDAETEETDIKKVGVEAEGHTELNVDKNYRTSFFESVFATYNSGKSNRYM